MPPFAVIGIIGVETFFGQQMGRFRVIDALATLAFDFPPGRKDRSAFFRDELGELLALAQRASVDPLSLLGSYAGAMGMPQFMPSSHNKYAIDFDGDGHIDLHASTADVIGSVAHYLAEFGWQRERPTHFEVAAPVEVADRAALLVPDIVPSFDSSAAERRQRGRQLRGRHDELLRDHALQLVGLLRDGGDRAWARDRAGARLTALNAVSSRRAHPAAPARSLRWRLH